MKVLLSAYACAPDSGSEPGVGWNWVLQCARFHEVWVITRANNRSEIEGRLADGSLPNVHWVYFDLPRWARFWKKKQRGLRPYYYLWQLGAYLKCRRLHRQVQFDVVHHVTFVNYWMPSFMALLPTRFLWGPVGGGESAPHSFWRHFSLRGKLYEFVRNGARTLGGLDPFVRLTARRAAVAFSTTRDTRREMLKLGCSKVIVFSEAGLPAEEILALKELPANAESTFRVLSVGRLLHWKGFSLGLQAFAELQRGCPESEYWIIGTGPEQERLKKLAQELGVAGRVRFWGRLSRMEVLDKLRGCDVLLHPSLHDSGGWVCLESMAAGRPVVCLDLGGPAVQVDDETGFKVQPTSPQETVKALAGALVKLNHDPALRQRLSEAGRARVQQYFDWNKKGDWMNKLYANFHTC